MKISVCWEINSSTPYHKSLVGVDDVEEAREQVPGDVKEGQNDDVPDLHEPRAVEAVSRDHHDQEVEGGEEGAEDDKDGKDGREADIEKAVEEGAGTHLPTHQYMPTHKSQRRPFQPRF